MASHYDVLGVSPQASDEELRKAYLGLARQLHPDRTGGTPPAEAARTARRMQEVNEAWRVLRKAPSRDAYDRALAAARQSHPPSSHVPPGAAPAMRRHDLDDDEDLDRVFTSAPAQPGDIGVSVARALPWVAVGVVLLAIFVFTAFAGQPSEPVGPSQLVGRCVSSRSAGALVPVPCDEPNDGEAVLLVSRASLCPEGSVGRSVDDGRWLCLRADDDGRTETTEAP